MSLNTQEIKSIFKLTYCKVFPLHGVTVHNGKYNLFHLDKTWQEVAAGDLLSRLERRFELGLFKDGILWLKSGKDPYTGSKPFEIWRIGLEGNNTLTLIVRGQKTNRIQKKWIRKLSAFFKSGIHLIWEEDIES